MPLILTGSCGFLSPFEQLVVSDGQLSPQTGMCITKRDIYHETWPDTAVRCGFMGIFPPFTLFFLTLSQDKDL